MKFLIITRTNWNEPPRARHQLARALAKNHLVVFVAINQKGKPAIKIEKGDNNITVITPTWWVQGKINMRIPLINELYQKWIYEQLTSKYKEYLVINFDITAVNINKYFDTYIYYCVDNFITVKRAKSLIIAVYWGIMQKYVTRNALFCCCSSFYLKKKLSKYNSSSYLFLSGANYLKYDSNLYKKTNIEITNIVYVGWLYKVNFKWVDSLANNGKYMIYLIGPIESVNKRIYGQLKRKNNIHIITEKKGDELREYIEKSDVCIAPYIHDKDTREVYTMPNKFWLYLSYGKPIVTTKINNLIELPNKYVYNCSNLKEFIFNIKLAVTEDSSDLQNKRREFIKMNNWDIRCNEFIKLCTSHVNQKNNPK